MLKSENAYADRVSVSAAVMMAAMLEQMTKDVLLTIANDKTQAAAEAGEKAHKSKKTVGKAKSKTASAKKSGSRILPHDVLLSVRKNDYLKKLFAGASIVQGGVVPLTKEQLQALATKPKKPKSKPTSDDGKKEKTVGRRALKTKVAAKPKTKVPAKKSAAKTGKKSSVMTARSSSTIRHSASVSSLSSSSDSAPPQTKKAPPKKSAGKKAPAKKSAGKTAPAKKRTRK